MVDFKTDATDKVVTEIGDKFVIDVTEEDLEADRYTIGVNPDDGLLRVRFLNEDGLLSSFTTDSGGAYDLAQRILRGFDKLEGL